MLLAVFVLTLSEKYTSSGLVASTWEFYASLWLINMKFPGGASKDIAPACRSQGEMKQIYHEEITVVKHEYAIPTAWWSIAASHQMCAWAILGTLDLWVLAKAYLKEADFYLIAC